jgi:leucyl/phenylalanyl-tRNA--protein transferase
MTWWDRVWRDGPAGRRPGDVPVALTAGLTADELVQATRAGMFALPLAADVADEYLRLLASEIASGEVVVERAVDGSVSVAWMSPDPRPVVPVGTVVVDRDMRRTVRNNPHWTTTIDAAFGDVVRACADGRRTHWLDDRLRSVLHDLHVDGWAHSVEVWSDSRLIGGLFGLGLSPVFSGDSMFHRENNAGKLALAALDRALVAAGAQVMDLQWDSPHLMRLGGVRVPRMEYLAMLPTTARRMALRRSARPVGELLERVA